jgi:hypothetical protein
MAINDFTNQTKLFFTRLKIGRPSLPIFPQFKTTLVLLWLVSVIGMLYGHLVLKLPDGQSLSYLCTLLAWGGALLILLLRQTYVRFKILLSQTASLFLAVLFVATLPIAYSLTYYATNPPLSIQIAWLSGVVILGCVAFMLVWRSFVRSRLLFESPYPGFRSAPLLFLVVMVNYVWWQWPFLVSWFR